MVYYFIIRIFVSVKLFALRKFNNFKGLLILNIL